MINIFLTIIGALILFTIPQVLLAQSLDINLTAGKSTVEMNEIFEVKMESNLPIEKIEKNFLFFSGAVFLDLKKISPKSHLIILKAAPVSNTILLKVNSNTITGETGVKNKSGSNQLQISLTKKLTQNVNNQFVSDRNFGNGANASGEISGSRGENSDARSGSANSTGGGSSGGSKGSNSLSEILSSLGGSFGNFGGILSKLLGSNNFGGGKNAAENLLKDVIPRDARESERAVPSVVRTPDSKTSPRPPVDGKDVMTPEPKAPLTEAEKKVAALIDKTTGNNPQTANQIVFVECKNIDQAEVATINSAFPVSGKITKMERVANWGGDVDSAGSFNSTNIPGKCVKKNNLHTITLVELTDNKKEFMVFFDSESARNLGQLQRDRCALFNPKSLIKLTQITGYGGHSNESCIKQRYALGTIVGWKDVSKELSAIKLNTYFLNPDFKILAK